MTTPKPGKPATKNASDQAATREDRLKAALKANLARRKAQARARSTGSAVDNDKKR